MENECKYLCKRKALGLRTFKGNVSCIKCKKTKNKKKT